MPLACRDHEHKWLSKLQHGGLLVLKGGGQQFMFQPEVCHDFRMNAEGFAAAADWDAPDKPSQPGSCRSSIEISTDTPPAATSTETPLRPVSLAVEGKAGDSTAAEQTTAEVEVQVTLTATAGALTGASKQQLLELSEAAQPSLTAPTSAGRAGRRVTAPALPTHSLQLQQGILASAAEQTAGRTAARRTTSAVLGGLSVGAGTGGKEGCRTAVPALEKDNNGTRAVFVNAMSLLRPAHRKDALQEPCSAASFASYEKKALRRHSIGT